MGYDFQFASLLGHTDELIAGAWLTIRLSAAAMVFGLIVAIACALARTSGPRWLGWIVAAYVEVIRNTPLLVQLFLIFFGLPSFGVRLDGLTAAIIALVINLGAYTTEIVRAGLEAVPKAQVEAGHSLGLSGLQVFRYVVMFPACLLYTSRCV